MSERTLVVSATNLLRRGFVTIPTDRQTESGETVNALFGVVRALRRAIALKRPERAIAVFESTPVEWPELLEPQWRRLPDLLQAHGLRIVEGADEHHIVASYTQAALDRGDDVVVLASDKRFAQLVGDRVWWYDAYKDARYTSDMVEKRFCVGPDLVAQWLALVGDDDALPGIKGIGKKGATDLLTAHGSVDGALANIDQLGGRTKNALQAAIDQIPIELARAQLDRARATPQPLDELVFEAGDEQALNEQYVALGFFELLSSTQADAVDVAVCDDAEAVQSGLTALGEGPIAIQALIEEPSAARGVLIGIALAEGGKRGLYVRDPELLRAWLEDQDRPKIGHDVKSAVVALARVGITMRGVVGDSACASHLTEPSNRAPHDLPIIARQVLRHPLPDADSVQGVGRRKKRWGAVAGKRAAAFSVEYAAAAARAWHELAPQVQGELLTEYLELCDTLVRMELRGLAVDDAELAGADDDFVTIEADLEKEIYAHAGREFNLASSKQLGEVLFEDLELPVLRHTKTGWSTATEALERIEHAHPIVRSVIRWRRLRRLRSTWITALRQCIDDDGRVRSSFHPARSFSGRLVNSSPDLGRVPGRTIEMQRIRRAFVAPPGSVLLSLDYQQLGLYVLAHLTEDPALVEPLSKGVDMHTLTAAAVLERSEGSIDKDARQIGKIVNFATFAGQGASSLALQLGITAMAGCVSNISVSPLMISTGDRPNPHATAALFELDLALLREDRDDVVGESSAVAFAQPVPAPDRVVVGASPRFHGPGFGARHRGTLDGSAALALTGERSSCARTPGGFSRLQAGLRGRVRRPTIWPFRRTAAV